MPSAHLNTPFRLQSRISACAIAPLGLRTTSGTRRLAALWLGSNFAISLRNEVLG